MLTKIYLLKENNHDGVSTSFVKELSSLQATDKITKLVDKLF